MPVIPTFSGFAQTPDLGGSYLGGANVALGEARLGQEAVLTREKIAQQAAEAGARINLGYAEIAARRQQAEAEHAMKLELAAQERMREDAKLEIDRSYKQQLIGLQESNLERTKALADLQVQQAARTFEAQQGYQADLAAAGMDKEKQMQAALKWMPLMGRGLPSSAFQMPSPELGTVKEIPGVGKSVQTGPNQLQIIKSPKPEVPFSTRTLTNQAGANIGTLVTLPSGREQIVQDRPDPRLKMFKEELKDLNASLETARLASGEKILDMLDPASKAYKKAGPREKAQVDQYLKDQARKDMLEGLIKELEQPVRSAAPTAATLPAGMGGGGATNRVGRFQIITQ